MKQTRSGRELFSVLGDQRRSRDESLKHLIDARRSTGHQLEGLRQTFYSSKNSDQDDHDETQNENNYHMYKDCLDPSRVALHRQSDNQRPVKHSVQPKIIQLNKFNRTNSNLNFCETQGLSDSPTTAGLAYTKLNAKTRNGPLISASVPSATPAASRVNIDEYFAQNEFDGAREIAKEIDIESLFI